MQDARRYTDRFGFSWQVCELWSPDPTLEGEGLADAASAQRGWLYFFSRGTTLVLQAYPPDWELLSWADLERLSERAQVLGSDTAIRLPAGARNTEGVLAHL